MDLSGSTANFKFGNLAALKTFARSIASVGVEASEDDIAVLCRIAAEMNTRVNDAMLE